MEYCGSQPAIVSNDSKLYELKLKILQRKLVENQQGYEAHLAEIERATSSYLKPAEGRALINTINHQRDHIDELRKQKDELEMRLVSAENGAVLWEEEAKKWQKIAEERDENENLKTEPSREVRQWAKKIAVRMAKAAKKQRRKSRYAKYFAYVDAGKAKCRRCEKTVDGSKKWHLKEHYRHYCPAIFQSVD